MKKILTLALAAVMLVGLLAACNNDGGQPASSAPSPSAGSANSPASSASAAPAPNVPDEPVKITIFQTSWGEFPADIDPSNNKWADIFKEEFPALDITWMFCSEAEYTERKNLLMGSGDFPDVLRAQQEEIGRWAEQGLIHDLHDFHDRLYPNVYNFLTPDEIRTTTYNGRIYAIKGILNGNSNPGFSFIRLDWLERLGMSMPTTIDELYDVMYAFTYGDPTGTGATTYAISGSTQGLSFDHLHVLWHSFGIVPGFWKNVNGTIIPDIIRPEAKEAIAFMRRCWEDGLIDKDTLVNQGQGEVEAKGTQGLIGMTTMASWGMAVRAYPNMLEGDPNAKVTECLPMAYNGKIEVPLNRNGGHNYVVTVACDYPELIVQFFNWSIEQDLSREPLYMLNLDKIISGEVGVHSIITGDRYVMDAPNSFMTPEALNEQYRFSYRLNHGTIQSLVGDDMVNAYRGQVEDTRARGEIMHECAYTSKDLVFQYGRKTDATITGPAFAEYWTDLTTYYKEMLAGVITGNLPLDDFDKWVDFFYANGGTEIIKEINELN